MEGMKRISAWRLRTSPCSELGWSSEVFKVANPTDTTPNKMLSRVLCVAGMRRGESKVTARRKRPPENLMVAGKGRHAALEVLFDSFRAGISPR